MLPELDAAPGQRPRSHVDLDRGQATEQDPVLAVDAEGVPPDPGPAGLHDLARGGWEPAGLGHGRSRAAMNRGSSTRLAGTSVSAHVNPVPRSGRQNVGIEIHLPPWRLAHKLQNCRPALPDPPRD